MNLIACTLPHGYQQVEQILFFWMSRRRNATSFSSNNVWLWKLTIVFWLCRKKRRRLEAERQAANDREEMDGQEDPEPKRKRSKQEDESPQTSLVDVGYRRAKGAKSIMKMKEAGLIDPKKIAAMKGVKGKKVKKKKVNIDGQEGPRDSEAGAGSAWAALAKKKEHVKPRKAFKSKKRYKRK
jgi:hypothetical protein